MENRRLVQGVKAGGEGRDSAAWRQAAARASYGTRRWSGPTRCRNGCLSAPIAGEDRCYQCLCA